MAQMLAGGIGPVSKQYHEANARTDTERHRHTGTHTHTQKDKQTHTHTHTHTHTGTQVHGQGSKQVGEDAFATPSPRDPPNQKRSRPKYLSRQRAQNHGGPNVQRLSVDIDNVLEQRQKTTAAKRRHRDHPLAHHIHRGQALLEKINDEVDRVNLHL